MPAVVRDIRDASLQLPQFIIVDASLLLELVPNSPPHRNHIIAIEFLNRIRNAAQRGEVIPLISYLGLEEFFFKICQIYLDEKGKSHKLKWHEYYKKNPSFISATIYPVLIKHYQMLKAFPLFILEPVDLTTKSKMIPLAECMIDFIGRFNILPKDATILSEAKRIGVFCIATLDGDFLRADGFTILFPKN